MNRLKTFYTISFSIFICLAIMSCQSRKENPKTEKKPKSDLSKDFKDYWFDGKAEIASYKLTQMRYGETRSGEAVLIFVKEPFLPKEQVKANSSSQLSYDVLKLNATKQFNTGIYPYSIMQSTFSPLHIDAHATKVSASTQEWCGQTYMQMNNREQFIFTSHSYFEGEADQKLTLDQTTLENEIWTKLRIAPNQIKTGQQKIIPDFSFLRLKHKPIKAYDAIIFQENQKDTLVTKIEYSEIERIVNIYQSAEFPYPVLKWEEKTSKEDKKFTQAVLQKRMKIDYWNKNSDRFTFLRDSLQLK